MTLVDAGSAAGHVAALGLGYTGRALAQRLKSTAWRVTGSSRSDRGVAQIEADGYRGLVLNEETTTEALAAQLESVTHILISASPSAAGDPLIRQLGAVAPALAHLRWIGYLSTIGVYGDYQGGWVDEATRPTPSSSRGAWRMLAEEGWRAFGEQHGVKVQIFRLPGIYGPGRSLFERLQDGTTRRIIKAGQVFNRMHVDDIAGALERAMMTADASSSSLFNLSDDLPAAPQDAIVYAAGLMGIEPPPEVAFEDAEMSAMARDFYSQNKRVSNARMKAELGYQLMYPTYREGLQAIWKGMRGGAPGC